MTPRSRIAAKLRPHGTERLMEMARATVGNDADGADTVQSAILDELQARLPEPAFLSFLRDIEALEDAHYNAPRSRAA